MNIGFKGGIFMVKVGGKFGYKGESDIEVEDERLVVFGFVEDYLGEGLFYYWDYYFELGK